MGFYHWTPTQIGDLGFYEFIAAVDVAQKWLENDSERSVALLKALVGSR